MATPVEDNVAGGRRHGIISFFKELPVLIALALGIALIIKAFLIQAFFIPSGSMEPTLAIHDRVLVNKLTYRFHKPERGDIVVFEDPSPPQCRQIPGLALPPECNKSIPRKARDWFAELFGIPTGDNTKDFIKRIVALPGEEFEMRDGDVFINGRKTDFESKKGVEGPQKDETDWTPVKIPKDHYWVLGDNRANSSDSRTFRSIHRDKVVGKAFVIVWPPKRFGGL
ncbi:MAG TPA: signal peptidase I [Actinomycetota bacterium]|nr:signal peptidase I [Actinomycetota bacterium]